MVGKRTHPKNGVVGALRAIRCCCILLAALLMAESVSSKNAISIGYSDWPGWVAWEVAKEKGLFQRHGVDVNLVWFTNYTDSITALTTGKLDGNCMAWSDVMKPIAEGTRLKVVLVNDNSAGNDAIVAGRNFNSVKELKGKSVATEWGTVDYFMLLKALDMSGMTTNDIIYKNLPVPDAATAFISGEVDAAAIWQPWISQIYRQGKGRIIFSSKEIPGLIPDLLVFQEKVVAERPEEIQKIVATWFDVVDFIETRKTEAVRIMARVVEQKPVDYFAFMPGTRFFDLKANLGAFEMRDDDASLAKSGRKIAEFLKNHGMLTSIPDYEAALEPKFIKVIKR